MSRERMAFASALLALAACLASASPASPPPSDAAPPSSGAARAILVRGAYPVKGIPFFPPNALSALVGSYGPSATVEAGTVVPAAEAPAMAATAAATIVATDETEVWFTREALVLGPAWKRESLGGSEYFVLARPHGPVLALKKTGYYLLFALPAGASPEDRSRLSFIRAFDRKFSAFATNAPTDAELSFPAYVDY